MKINYDTCVGCGMCAAGFNDDKKCPAGALSFTDKPRIDGIKCVDCGLCRDLCALGAIEND